MWMPRKVRPLEGHPESGRHEDLFQARTFLAAHGTGVEAFRLILVVVRNPYDLEVSRYHYMRKGHHGIRGLAHELAQKIAIEGDFEQFALTAPYHGQMPARIERWYELDGRIPTNMRIARFECLEDDLRDIVGKLSPIRRKLRRLNSSGRGPYRDYLTSAAEEAIYRKFRWVFDQGFYRREAA
jgi:hypothetical protein